MLKNKNAKLNWQASPNDMVSLFWFDGAKVKLGRDPGLVGDEPDNSFLWNQGNFYPGRGLRRCPAACTGSGRRSGTTPSARTSS